jgi:hypothetical protein
MVDHIILTVSNIECSLAFYEAALGPLNIRFFLTLQRRNAAILTCGDSAMEKERPFG